MVIDVTEDTFEQEVLERSRQGTPVVVDFWASWCGPCRQLTPVLEKATAAREGDVVLAKVDTDANPRLSQAFGIQGIPAVKAFKDGEVVDEFVGAQPPAQVERFFDGIVPSEVDALVAEGGEERLRRALELDPRRADARVALARLVDREEALALLGEVPPGDFAAEGLGARLRLEDDAELAPAFAALDRGDHDEGVDALIDAIAATPRAEQDRKDDLRRIVVGVLDELGVEHPLARDARRRLATALF